MRHLFKFGIAALVVVVSVNSADAGWLKDFTGYTVFGKGGFQPWEADGHVSFAVYENDLDGTGELDDNASSPFDGFDFVEAVTFSPTFDATANYLFLYQVVNSDPVNSTQGDPNLDAEASLATLEIPVALDDVTSWGGLWTPGNNPKAYVFLNAAGDAVGFDSVAGKQVVAIGSPDPDAGSGGADDSGDGVPSEKGLTLPDPEFEAIDSGAVAIASNTNLEPGTGDLDFDFGTDGIAAGGFSVVMWFTSITGPQYKSAQLTGSVSTGDIPTNPVPGGLVLLLTALPGLAWLRRKKLQKVA